MTDRNRIYFRLLVFPFVLALLMPCFFKTFFSTYTFGSVYYYLIAFLMSFGLVPLFYKLGVIMNITDIPGGRHNHGIPTPRTGGLAIFITFIASLNIYTNPPPEFTGLFWAIIIIAGFGILDDINGLPAWVKLIGQIMATAVLIYHGIFISFIPDHEFWNIFSIILTFLWVIGITNAVNFLDGLDGLASGLAITVSLFYAAISWSIGNRFVFIVSVFFMGAVSGFFVYNFRIGRRALIFLGDTGSTIIGFTLAAIAIYGDWGIHKSVDLAIPILLLAVPITDMLLTNIMRISTGKVHSFKELLEYAGNDHLHHRLKALGLKPKSVVIILCVFTMIMGLLSLLLKYGDYFESFIALGIGILIFSVVVSLMVFQERKNGNYKKK
ncbi:MAG: undecaprenyl/decaprenyl-phosphate alpha-N-acetylglucosaminyl 1-phosphate transferase [Candidatus Marinimicrobia bacterium]|nr:undecaprenyl/decaprenyl-phosphate alpha-N-acetylglucosaminyl 1-phosphate transferase [Candidatus Neomarinimicrobiota bacterium]